MTDTEVEGILIRRFEDECSPLLTYEKVSAIKKAGQNTGAEEAAQKCTNIAYENKSFKRPPSGYWFEFHFIPSVPVAGIGQFAPNRWKGIMQINVCVPLNTDTRAMNARFDAIFRAFPRGYITNGLRIVSVSRSAARAMDDYCFMPVSISWDADLPNKE